MVSDTACQWQVPFTLVTLTVTPESATVHGREGQTASQLEHLRWKGNKFTVLKKMKKKNLEIMVRITP